MTWTRGKDSTKPWTDTRQKNNGLDKAYAMAVEYCAIGRESKKAEDGRRALEHTRAERLVVWNFGEKDIKTIRVILAANGIYAVDMTDIDDAANGDPGPGGILQTH